MAPCARVLKFTTTDTESGYVLLNVISRGSKPLDLKIEATEGDEEYAHSLRHDKVASLRVKNCPASETEWQDILQRVFSQNPHLDVQVTATVHTGSSIAIVFRRSTQGVTQRLGEFKIPIAKDAGYNVLDWCATASNAVAESQAIATSATAKVRDLEATMKDLKSQLDELLKAKEDDETTLLLKFRDLLNEKKVKIREQRKIIASLPTSSLVSQAQPSQTTRLSPPPVQQEIKQSGSRSTKRKAAVPVVEDDSSEGGFEPMEFDKIKSEPEDTDPSNDTESTASTASDDEEDVAPIPAPAVSSQGLKTPLKNTAAKPPPPRALPFARNKPGPASPARPPTGAESETESDDEL